MKEKEYDLPDARLLTDNYPGSGVLVWVPGFFCIVLGQSNKPEESINIEQVKKDNIPVYKRPSGGEAVILSPHTLAISFLKRDEPLRSPRHYFEMYNKMVIKALRSLGIQNLAQKGISDICIRDKKVLGSSIYRNKNVLLYQAVLNISEPVLSLEKYLKHPPREPHYRDKRSHKDFVTSLTAQGYHLSAEKIKKAILSN
jgi:lipoate-protein ligase A